MNYPFYKCTKCDVNIAELSFPIHPAQQYPKCPECHSNKNVDIAIGDETTVLDSEMVIYSDELGKVKGRD